MVVLDASAVLALLNGEPGADRVEALLPDATVSAVNLEEVVGLLLMQGVEERVVERVLTPLALPVVAYTEEMAWLSGAMRPRLPAGLGIADRACLATARVLGATAVTADHLWQAAAAVFGVEVELIR